MSLFVIDSNNTNSSESKLGSYKAVRQHLLQVQF